MWKLNKCGTYPDPGNISSLEYSFWTMSWCYRQEQVHVLRGKYHHLYLVRLCLMTPTQTDMSRVKGLTKKWAKFLFPYFNWEDNSFNFNELKLFWVRYIHLFSILYVNNVFLKYSASWECTLLYGNNLIKMLYQM